MPGLVGIIWNDKFDQTLLDRMAGSIKHEDWHKIDTYSDIFFSGARVHLGIFNPEPQPIFNEDRTLCIFMYGKIYGYHKEFVDLKTKGHRFATGNDADFCLHLYEEMGSSFVNNLNGSFILMIYDIKSKKIIIANDRYGFRPIYWAKSNGKLLFSSEVKAILKDADFCKKINDASIADFFRFGEILGNKTFFEGIETLPPATILILEQDKIIQRQYWDLNFKPDYSLSEEELLEQITGTLVKAVDLRMRDKFRYGVLLSGGFDSRTMLSAIGENHRNRITALTFGLPACDEIKVAGKIAKQAGVAHTVVEFEADQLINHVEEVVWLSDGMDIISVSYLPYIQNVARKHFDVFLHGLHMEDLLGDYCADKETLKSKSFEELHKIWVGKMTLFPPQDMSELFINSYYPKIKNLPAYSLSQALHEAEQEGPVGNSIDFSLRNHARRFAFLGIIIERNKTEEILPSFDNSFIDIVLKIPPEMLSNYYIYKKILKKLAPELAAIPYQRTMVRADAPLLVWKIGEAFQSYKIRIYKQIGKLTNSKLCLPNKRNYINIEEWLRSNQKWRDLIGGLLLYNQPRSEAYFNKDYIETLISQHISGKSNQSRKLVYLATFELFLRMFFE